MENETYFIIVCILNKNVTIQYKVMQICIRRICSCCVLYNLYC